jgi:putative oxidoreductase
MKGQKIIRIAQILFGVCLLTVGVNIFFNFLPLAENKGFAKLFIETLHQSKYLFPTIGCIQIFAGLSLMLNRWLTLSLFMLLPISFNIFLFHLLHAIESFVPAAVILGVNIALLWMRKEMIKSLFCKQG